MPDYSYLARPQSGNALETIGNVLQMARGATALQRERGTLQADIERAKAESSRAGTEATVAAQTAPTRIEEQQAKTSAAKTAALSAEWHFQGQQAQKAHEIVSGLAQDPRVVKGDGKGSVEALMSAEEMMRNYKIPESTIKVQMAPLYGMAASNPQGLRQSLDNIVRGNAGVAAQAALGNAPEQALNTGANLVPFQAQPGSRPAGGNGIGAPIAPVQVPPGQRQEVGFNPVTKSPMVTEKDAAGNVVNVRPAPTQGNIPQLNPGDVEAIPKLTDMRSAVNQAASRVPETKFNNAQIIKLADETNTGKGAEIVRNLKGGYAMLPWTSDSAKNFDSMGHFIARESANMISSMGANTDASRGIAEQANVSTGWTREAVKTAAKVNNALASGMEKFNQGMEKAVAANGGNVLAVRDFQNKWSQAFDPNVYRFANALEANDKAEITKILGPEGSAQRQARALELARKSAMLNRLSEQGQ